SVITENAGSSRVTRPGAIGSATLAPGATRVSVSGAYSRMEPPLFLAGELRAAPEMLHRFLRPADHLHQRGQLHVAVVRRLGREARLDVALRLAPQALAHAELAQRQQQRRVARMHAQPLLRALDLRQRLARGRLAVQSDQARVPLALERLL